jgi:hypothetical protein
MVTRATHKYSKGLYLRGSMHGEEEGEGMCVCV